MSVRLGQSRIHGTGVFADRAFAPGETIIEYLGERISHEEADERSMAASPHDGHTMLFTLNDSTVIDGNINGNEARYINHSCDPNCEAVIYDDTTVMIDALRPIQPGEELFIDYCLDLTDLSLAEAYQCRCNSKNCRGTMLGVALT